MFVVEETPTFRHTVTADVPVDGGFSKQQFGVTFRLLDSDAADELDLSTRKGSDEFLRSIIVELHDLVDAKKQPVAYSDAVRDQVIALPWARRAIVRSTAASRRASRA